jgi:hypothetical protein
MIPIRHGSSPISLFTCTGTAANIYKEFIFGISRQLVIKTPTSVIVLSVIGIIIAAFGILIVARSATHMFVEASSASMYYALTSDPVYRFIRWMSLAVHAVETPLLLVASIASLRLRPWSRRGMIIYAWITASRVIVGIIVSVVYVMPKMMTTASASATGPAPTSTMIVGLCMVPFFLIFPACVLYFFTRTNVINAFNGIFPASPTDFPVIFPAEQSPPTT